jgi:hypothetical protein
MRVSNYHDVCIDRNDNSTWCDFASNASHSCVTRFHMYAMHGALNRHLTLAVHANSHGLNDRSSDR